MADDLRACIGQLTNVAVEYWSVDVASARKSAVEARIRMLESELRENLTAFRVAIKDPQRALSAYQIEYLKELTGGSFEVKHERRVHATDVERARRIAHLGARMRGEVSSNWRNHLEANSFRMRQRNLLSRVWAKVKSLGK